MPKGVGYGSAKYPMTRKPKGPRRPMGGKRRAPVQRDLVSRLGR